MAHEKSLNGVDNNSIEFAKFILDTVEFGLKMDSKVLNLYTDLDDQLDTCIEDMSAAHLMSFIWCVLSNIAFDDMVLSADEVAEIIKKDLLDALRSSLIKIYKEDVKMGFVTYSSEDEEQLNTIRQILGPCGNCRTRSCHDEHDVTDRELDSDFDDMEGK